MTKAVFEEPIYTVSRTIDGGGTDLPPNGQLDSDTYVDFVLARGATASLRIGDRTYSIPEGAPVQIKRTFLRGRKIVVTLYELGELRIYGHLAPGTAS